MIGAKKIFLGAAIFTLLLFGRSLPFTFVYDDHWRIDENPSIQSLANPLRFLRPDTQSSHSQLSTHTYRPLVTFSFAVDWAFWQDRAVYYRFENFLVHAANATLIVLLGQWLFQLSLAGAAIGALFFLFHPAQTEAVVWISGRSDVWGLFFLLSSIAFWTRYRQTRALRPLVATFLCFVLGLLTRENAVCLPPALILLDETLLKSHEEKTPRHERFKAYLLMGILTAAYLVARTKLLDRVSQHPIWVDSGTGHAATICKVWFEYLRVFIWPDPLRLTYFTLAPAPSFAEVGAVLGALSLALIGVLIARAYKRDARWSVALILTLLLWLPGSGVIPLAALFSERFLYPLLATAGFMAGLAYDAAKNKRVARITASLLIGLYANLVFSHLPVWRDDETLWKNAVLVEPENYLAWGCLADATLRTKKGPDYLDRSENYYIEGLKRRPRNDLAGEMFIALAEINLLQGKKKEAAEHARRGLILRPDLEFRWKNANP